MLCSQPFELIELCLSKAKVYCQLTCIVLIMVAGASRDFETSSASMGLLLLSVFSSVKFTAKWCVVYGSYRIL